MPIISHLAWPHHSCLGLLCVSCHVWTAVFISDSDTQWIQQAYTHISWTGSAGTLIPPFSFSFSNDRACRTKRGLTCTTRNQLPADAQVGQVWPIDAHPIDSCQHYG